MSETVSSTSWTTRALLQATTKYLLGKQIDEPRLAAERLLAHVLQCDRMDLYLDPDRPLSEVDLNPYRDLVRRCASLIPLQYLTEETEFMGLAFHTDPRALIPRPETEILVDAVLRSLKEADPTPVSILELGVGSGVIGVSLAKKAAQVCIWGTDIDPNAVQLAAKNARRHEVEDQLRLMVLDRFEGISPQLYGSFDWLVSNPPYVTRAEMEQLPALVKDHEPAAALYGGADGLDYYRYLCDEGRRFVKPGGRIAVEIGARQGPAVVELFQAAGFESVTLLQDYATLDRVVVANGLQKN